MLGDGGEVEWRLWELSADFAYLSRLYSFSLDWSDLSEYCYNYWAQYCTIY